MVPLREGLGKAVSLNQALAPAGTPNPQDQRSIRWVFLGHILSVGSFLQLHPCDTGKLVSGWGTWSLCVPRQQPQLLKPLELGSWAHNMNWKFPELTVLTL